MGRCAGNRDLRGWIERLTERNGFCALPVVVGKSQPLAFRRWSPGEPLKSGVWNIKIPKAGENVRPNIVIAPVLGFDSYCFRLGYGGGYFDRTLATLSPKPRILGVGYACTEITTIYPQPHDIAMDMMVTEAGVSLPHKE
ncbi:5-formyltetrahydrofolate cyclo-ligase [Magnetovibrio blakemorei]|uniref:5-formyltetrahydrofolate cyclo-ligase n=1 Tax=Magnetovibrio blakemorei TaxID=28181 RepID=UPI001B8CA54F